MPQLFSPDLIDWIVFTDQITPDKESVHVFKVTVDEYYLKTRSLYNEILSVKEVEKASRFLNTHDAERFIASRCALKIILSEFVSIAPSGINLQQSNNKKPYIKGIEFNVSHSGNYVFIAVGSTPIGIDAEVVREGFDFEQLLENCFNAPEIEFINETDSKRRLRFYGLWTRKEAVLKASGEGLTDNLTELECLSDVVTRKQNDYNLMSFIIDDNYVVSLASSINETRFFYWNYS